MMMRKVFRDHSYAVGTGNFRWVPGGDYADHNILSFNIVWHTTDRYRYLECYHPFWNSDGDVPPRHPDIWSKGAVSPFQQTAHDKNTAIVLFNVPDKDPWPEKPLPAKWEWRNRHEDNLLKRGQFRYPKSVDEMVEREGWIFLREGKVFIGVKSLKDYYIQKDLQTADLEHFNVVKSDHAQTGFVFEVGTQEAFVSFEVFQDQLIGNRMTVDWDQMTVNYTDSQKDELKIQFIPGLQVVGECIVPDHWEDLGVTGMAESVPVVTINGKSDIPYREWPMIESPVIHLNNNILELSDGIQRITVDWQDDYPKIIRTGS
jgi:hypothetical protein